MELIALALLALMPLDAAKAEAIVDRDYGVSLLTGGFHVSPAADTTSSFQKLYDISAIHPGNGQTNSLLDCGLWFAQDARLSSLSKVETVLHLADGAIFEKAAKDFDLNGIGAGFSFTHAGWPAWKFHIGGPDDGRTELSLIASSDGIVALECRDTTNGAGRELAQTITENLVVPGQKHPRIVPRGSCTSSKPQIHGAPEELPGALVQRLDAEWDRISAECGDPHAMAMMDAAILSAGRWLSYREFRRDRIIQAAILRLTPEQAKHLAQLHRKTELAENLATADRTRDNVLFDMGRRHLR